MEKMILDGLVQPKSDVNWITNDLRIFLKHYWNSRKFQILLRLKIKQLHLNTNNAIFSL